MDEVRTAPQEAGTGQTVALLDALFANVPVGLAFWDPELRFARINDELAEMNGLPVEEHLGRRVRDVLPDFGLKVEAILGRVLETGEAVRGLEIEGETLAARGVQGHWLADYFPVRDAGGALLGVAGLVVEVTGEREARTRAGEARRRSAFVDAELRALYSALPVGVAFLDPELRYQRVNETLAQLNGRRVEEHIGASLHDVLGDAAGGLVDALRQVMETRRPLDLQLDVPLPQDPEDVRSLEATYFPVVDGGELLGVGGVVRDVTDRRVLEVEQSRLLQEALVARADAEAAQVRTNDAREEAQRTGEEARRAHARMALLAEAGRRMAQSMDWETTLRAVVRSAVPRVADWSSLTMAEPSGGLRVVAVAHDDPARERLAHELFERYPPQADSPDGAGRVIATGRMRVVEDISPEMLHAAARDADHLQRLERIGLRHLATAPLRTPDGVVGALSFALGDSGRRFAEDDLQLIQSLAARAALHVQNARLYTERSNIARTLQTSLLPGALPPIPGAEVAVRYRPAGDQNMVGGDFYDVHRSGEGVWTAVVGDVAGKGASAAAITALARYTLRTASRLNDDPAANLRLLNEALRDDASFETFCTVFYARICRAGDGFDVRFANGGHPPPLVLRRGGSIEPVDGGRGPLVGAIDEARFQEAEIRLGPGDLLLMYTDGVTEVRPGDLGFGERELRRTLASQSGAAAGGVVAAIEEQAVRVQDGRPRDDIALVAIRVLEPA